MIAPLEYFPIDHQAVIQFSKRLGVKRSKIEDALLFLNVHVDNLWGHVPYPIKGMVEPSHPPGNLAERVDKIEKKLQEIWKSNNHRIGLGLFRSVVLYYLSLMLEADWMDKDIKPLKKRYDRYNQELDQERKKLIGAIDTLLQSESTRSAFLGRRLKTLIAVIGATLSSDKPTYRGFDCLREIRRILEVEYTHYKESFEDFGALYADVPSRRTARTELFGEAQTKLVDFLKSELRLSSLEKAYRITARFRIAFEMGSHRNFLQESNLVKRDYQRRRKKK